MKKGNKKDQIDKGQYTCECGWSGSFGGLIKEPEICCVNKVMLKCPDCKRVIQDTLEYKEG